jgi:hypothetical protein
MRAWWLTVASVLTSHAAATAAPVAELTWTVARPPLKARWIERSSSPALFLRPFTLQLSGSRGLNLREVNRRLPLNPIEARQEVFARNVGTDVMNALVVERSGDQAFVTLREQARAPVAQRMARGLPGGRSFTMSESFGGSLEAKGGQVERIEDNIRHEAAEELHIDARAFKTTTLFSNVAISPDRSAGAVHGVALETTRPVHIDNAKLQETASGEVAETGARALSRVPISRAIRYTQTGQIIDARTKLLLLSSALALGLPLDPKLAEEPTAAERAGLERDFDPERSEVPRNEYSRFSLSPSAKPTEEYQGRRLQIASAQVRFSSADGSRDRRDRFEHKTVFLPDQVSELPVVRGKDGALYVGLVPSVSAGVAARELPEVAAKTGVTAAPSPEIVQQRGLVRDVQGYRPASGPRGGNLGVEPICASELSAAHGALARLGLKPTDRLINLGQFNASVGENGFHMNLMVREFALPPGADPARLDGGAAIRFMPLARAVELVRTQPHLVDQMTQVQLLELALRNRVGFRFGS